MSSIDKYVADYADSCDSRVRCVKLFGRIKGYIGTELVFDIKDRYGYLDDTERKDISDGIREYRERVGAEAQERAQEAERKRREEAIRLENERKESISKAKDFINERIKTFKANKNAITKQYNQNDKIIKELQEKLSLLRAKVPGNKLDSLINRLENQKNNLDNINDANMKSLNDDIERLFDIRDNLNQDAGKDEAKGAIRDAKAMRFNTPRSFNQDELLKLDADLDMAIENARAIDELLSELDKLDGSLKERLRHEIEGLDILNSNDIDELSLQICEAIADERRNRERANDIKMVNELNELELKAKQIKSFRSYSIKGSYSYSDTKKEIKEKCNDLINKLSNLSDARFKATELNIDNAISELYKIAESPNETKEEEAFLSELVGEYKLAMDRINQYDSQYKEYLDKLKQLTDAGGTYDKDFEYERSIDQLAELHELYVNVLREQESFKMLSVRQNIIELMEEQKYVLIKKDGSQYYDELFFVNKEVPGVITRVFIDTYGKFRISLHRAVVNGEVISVDDGIEAARELEDNIFRVLVNYKKKYNSKLIIDMKHAKSFTSRDAMDSIMNNGDIEIPDDYVEEYNKQFTVKKAHRKERASSNGLATNRRFEAEYNTAQSNSRSYQAHMHH